MSRRGLAVVAFGLGVIAAPMGFTFVGSSMSPAVAQNTEETDFGVSELADDNTDPQKVFVELATQKADLLTPEELARETQVLRHELQELRATRKLREAEQQLRRLIEEHPESEAAKRATEMLERERG